MHMKIVVAISASQGVKRHIKLEIIYFNESELRYHLSHDAVKEALVSARQVDDCHTQRLLYEEVHHTVL